MKIITSVLAVCALARTANGQESKRLQFQSAIDRFELHLVDSGGTVDGKTADLTGIKDLLPALTGEVPHPCPRPKGRPDVTVKDGVNESGLFFKAGVLQRGENCLTISGDGLQFAPIHREYLIGPREGSIPLGPELTVARDGNEIVKLKREGREWVPADTGRLPNEDFFRRFVERLEHYGIRQRAGLNLAENKKHVTVKTAGKTYEFTKITAGTWALRKPGARWLETSDDWSFWYDLDDRTIEDGYADYIQTAGNPDVNADERLDVLRRFETTWSINQRNLYRRIALEPNVDPRLLKVAMQRLKRKPSREVAAIMIEILEGVGADDLKREAVNILRLQNPKGPVYPKAGSASDHQRVITAWVDWFKKAGR